MKSRQGRYQYFAGRRVAHFAGNFAGKGLGNFDLYISYNTLPAGANPSIWALTSTPGSGKVRHLLHPIKTLSTSATGPVATVEETYYVSYRQVDIRKMVSCRKYGTWH